MLGRLVAVVVGLTAELEVGRTEVRAVVVVVAGARVAVDDVVGLEVVVVLALLAVVDESVFLSVADPITLARRSEVAVEDFVVGAREEGVPASDMRLAELEMLFFSSPELATFDDFSSAELLIEARDRWVAVVAALGGLRTVLLAVVVGRVGGLLSVLLPVVEVREAGFAPLVDVIPAVRFGVVELVTGRLVAVDVVETPDFLAGEALALPASGLVTTSDLDSSPDKKAESTGVWGGISVSSGPAPA